MEWQEDFEQNINIRSIDRNELKRFMKSLVEIYTEGYRGLEKYAYSTPEKIKKYIQWLYRSDKDGFFVAFDGHKPIGFAGTNASWYFAGKVFGEIHEIVVHPDYSGRGIGSQLLDRSIEYLRKHGRTRAGLWVGVTNEGAKKFYLKNGFKPEGVYGRWERWEKEI